MNKELLRLREDVLKLFQYIKTENPTFSKFFYPRDEEERYPQINLNAVEEEVLRLVDDLIRERFKELLGGLE